MSITDVIDFREKYAHNTKPIYPQHLESHQDVRRSNQIPFLPMLPYADVDWDKMYHEAKSLSQHFVPHRSHESHKGWSSLCIHGLSSVHTEHHTYYGYEEREDAPYRWTDVSTWCPTITDFFQNDFDYTQYDRIRIMKLAPGGYIVPHRDAFDEQQNKIGPTNIALNNPEGCDFIMNGAGVLPWQQGMTIKLNVFNEHCVYNDSDEDRYHIIAHGKAGDSWSNRIWHSYDYYKSKYS